MTLAHEHAVILCGDHDGPHDLRWRGNRRKGHIYRYGTRAEVRVPRGTEPSEWLRSIVAVLLDGGCEIAEVGGDDVTDTAKFDSIDWSGE